MTKKSISTFLFMLLMSVVLLSSTVMSADSYSYYVAGGLFSKDSEAVLSILNPSDERASVEITAYFPKNDSVEFKDSVMAHAVRRLALSKMLPKDIKGDDFGLKIVSSVPIYIEHATYDAPLSCGFGDSAVSAPGFSWYFGDGFTSKDLNTWIFLLNPEEESADVEVTLYYETGQKRSFRVDVPAERSARVDTHDESLPDKTFGIKIASATAIVAETANYDELKNGCFGGSGASAPSKVWYFAEGYVSDSASESLSLTNPSEAIAHVTLTVYYDDGSTDVAIENIPLQSKRSLEMSEYVKKSGKWFSVKVESDQAIVAELSHHDDAYSASHGGVGVTSGAQETYFAEGYTSPNTKGYLAIFNPEEKDAAFEVTFFYEDGTVKTVEGSAKGLARTSVNIDKETFTFRPFGLRLSSGSPLVAQEIFYDKQRSSGYSSFGVQVMSEGAEAEETEEPVAETEDLGGTILMSEDAFDVSKFGSAAGEGLESAVKRTYSVDGEKVVEWIFGYGSEQEAAAGSGAMLSGSMFDLLERTPKDINGIKGFYVVAEKSEGFSWASGSQVFMVLANRGKMDSALALSEQEAEEWSGSRLSWWTVVLVVIIAVVVFLILKRIITGKKKGKKGKKADEDDGDEIDSDEEDGSEEDGEKQEVIEDASPKKPVKRSPVRQQRVMKKPSENVEKKAENGRRAEKKNGHPAPKNGSAKRHVKVKEIVADEDAEEEPDPKHAPKKSKHKKELVRVVEYDDMVKDAKDVPSYDDVFRHVNREYDEIKPK